MAELRRREFREFVRTHHPDVGGDPDVFADGVRRFRDEQARRLVPAAGKAVPAAGSFSARWPDWLRADDPRLRSTIVFDRRPHGPAGLLARLRRRYDRHRRPARVR